LSATLLTSELTRLGSESCASSGRDFGTDVPSLEEFTAGTAGLGFFHIER